MISNYLGDEAIEVQPAPCLIHKFKQELSGKLQDSSSHKTLGQP